MTPGNEGDSNFIHKRTGAFSIVPYFFRFGSDLDYHGEDFLSAKQFIVLGILLSVIVFLSIVLRKVKHKKIDVFLKVMAIIMPLTEAAKIHYCSVISEGAFSFAGDLPLYTCSVFMVALILSAFFKGRVRQAGLSFLTTLGIIAGLSNFIYLSALTGWPLLHYFSFNSIFFHGMMVFTGLWLLTSGYVEIKPINIHDSMMLILIFSAFAIPVTYEQYFTVTQGCDYMLYTGSMNLPILGAMADFFEGIGWLSLFTIIVMVVIYGILTTLVYFASLGIKKLAQRGAKGKPNGVESEG